MTTTELIKILQDNEKGGISHKPRNISLSINGRYMPNPQISLSSTGDGICGPEIDLDIEGEWFEQQPNRCDNCIHSEEQDGSNCYECVKGMADNFEAQPKIGYISIDVNKLAKEVAEKALDEITYNGKTIREWAEILVNQQPCEDCISRKQALDDKGLAVFHRYDDYVKMRNYLKALPPVTPERPKGKWIYDGDCILCNKCLKAFGWISMNMASNFCPNCGADMNGGKEDDEAM